MSLRVQGGRELTGVISASGNKNAALSLICASLLTNDPITLHNVPNITDVNKLFSFFELIGSKISYSSATQTAQIYHLSLPRDLSYEDIPRGMRSSVLLIPALLHRTQRVLLHSDTTGCDLGAREIDPHLNLMNAFGYTVRATPAQIEITGVSRVTGILHWLDYASVTTTENFITTACVAKGRSVLVNAACEPHVQDLCHFLVCMRARIQGIGSNTLIIDGVDYLRGCSFRVASDHHEIATYLALGALTGGSITVQNDITDRFPLIDRTFAKLGVQIDNTDGVSKITNSPPFVIQTPFTQNILTKVEAAPWPYFPTDLIAPFIALATTCRGEVLFWNKVYEGGLSWLPEMGKFGVHFFWSDPHRVIIFGGKPLYPAVVEPRISSERPLHY